MISSPDNTIYVETASNILSEFVIDGLAKIVAERRKEREEKTKVVNHGDYLLRADGSRWLVVGLPEYRSTLSEDPTRFHFVVNPITFRLDAVDKNAIGWKKVL